MPQNTTNTRAERRAPPKHSIKWHIRTPWTSVKVRKSLNGDTIGILFFINLKGKRAQTTDEKR